MTINEPIGAASAESPSPASPDADRLTAIHEAGHAVAHLRHGILQDYATLVPVDGYAGRVVSEGASSVYDEGSAEHMVLAYCAGYGALIAAGCSDSDSREGCESDFEEAQGLIDFWGLPGNLEAWIAKAGAYMRLPENLAAVTLVAQHLMLRKRLDADYLDALVELADGHITELEFVQFLHFRGLIPAGATTLAAVTRVARGLSDSLS